MKIAVTSTGKDLTSDMDPRFGRAAYFLIIDPDTMEYEVVKNTQALNLSKGAGIQAGQTVSKHNVNTLITGNCGPKAFQVLRQAQIQILVGAHGRVVDAIRQFKDGELQPAEAANVPGHWV